MNTSSPNGKLTGNILEVCKHTGFSRTQAQALIRERKLTNFGSDARFRVSWAELESYLSGKKAS